MLPVTVQFIVATLAYALNERMARKAGTLREANRVLKEALLEPTGRPRFSLTHEQRRRLATSADCSTSTTERSRDVLRRISGLRVMDAEGKPHRAKFTIDPAVADAAQRRVLELLRAYPRYPELGEVLAVSSWFLGSANGPWRSGSWLI